MKRVIPVLLGLFFAANLCMAQNSQTRLRRVTAIQELQADGMSAAHSNLPIGSKAKVTNPANGLEIEVTIIEQVSEADRQVIDLSPAAALALDIGYGGPVLVMPLGQPLQYTPAPEEIADSYLEPELEPDMVTIVESDTGAAGVAATEPEKQPLHITINNYIINPENPPPPVKERRERPVSRGKPVNDVQPEPKKPDGVAEKTPEVEAQPEVVATVLPPPQQTMQPERASLFTSPPVNTIQIIPSLPNPHTNTIYRLLVGTYSSVDSVFSVYLQLQAAGFEVIQEQVGDTCKVYAAGIPASMVYYAAQRLGAIGFQQVWIQE